jgi:hypothetical protein
MHDPKLKQRLHRIRVPTLVLWALPIALFRSPMGGPTGPPSWARVSSRSSAPVISHISSSLRNSGPDPLAYLGLTAVATDETEARRRGQLVGEYLRSGGIVWPPFRNPPAILPATFRSRRMPAS